MIHFTGDLLELARRGVFDVIVHGCNCQHTMGKGIAKSIREQFPTAYEADLRTPKGDRAKLGTISVAEVGPLTIVNGYTQFHYGGGVDGEAKYDAIRSVFREVRRRFTGRRIGYPRIGAGLGGGDWKLIADIIDEELAGESHALVVLP
ncbi:phosphatase [bacterium]|nr:MAG: phosphatase [bacterium]